MLYSHPLSLSPQEEAAAAWLSKNKMRVKSSHSHLPRFERSKNEGEVVQVPVQCTCRYVLAAVPLQSTVLFKPALLLWVRLVALLHRSEVLKARKLCLCSCLGFRQTEWERWEGGKKEGNIVSPLMANIFLLWTKFFSDLNFPSRLLFLPAFSYL